jgi:hypothetical protein
MTRIKVRVYYTSVIVLVSVGGEKLGSIFLDCKEAYYSVMREVLRNNIYEFFKPTKLAMLIKM